MEPKQPVKLEYTAPETHKSDRSRIPDGYLGHRATAEELEAGCEATDELRLGFVGGFVSIMLSIVLSMIILGAILHMLFG